MDTYVRSKSDWLMIELLACLALLILVMVFAIVHKTRADRAIRHTVTQYSATGQTLARWEGVYVRYEMNGRVNFVTREGAQVTITQPYMTVQEASK